MYPKNYEFQIANVYQTIKIRVFPLDTIEKHFELSVPPTFHFAPI